MEQVERKAERETPEPASLRFVLASASYAVTLHGRLIAAGRDSGASCLDCHAPDGLRHAIRADESGDAATHAERRADTCSRGGCHGFAGHDLNHGFLHTDLHDTDMAPLWLEQPSTLSPLSRTPYWLDLSSIWVRALLVLSTLGLLMLALWLLGGLFGRHGKGAVYSALGGGVFKRRMLGMRREKKKQRRQLSPARREVK